MLSPRMIGNVHCDSTLHVSGDLPQYAAIIQQGGILFLDVISCDTVYEIATFLYERSAFADNEMYVRPVTEKSELF